MKRDYIFFLIFTAIIFFNVCMKYRIDDLSNSNRELLKFFNKYYLVDANGNVDLSEVKSIKKDAELRVKKLYNVDEIDYDNLEVLINDKKNKNKILSEKIVSSSKKSSDLDSEINSLSNQYLVVKRKYDNYLETKSLVLLSNVPTINQYPNYYTGCESVALTILLRYYNINISPNQVIDSLKKTGLPYSDNGVMYGGNPELEFIGNPYGNGYGVFEHPIADVANKYKSGIHIEKDFPLSRVFELVKNGHPVQVWSSMYLALPYVSTSWIYKPTGEKINWHANEHAVVVVGYNNNNVIISDPIGGAIKYQSRSVFESRYNYYGRRALYYL